MTWTTREHRDGLAADRQIERGACGHGRACQCLRNIGSERYKAKTAELKARNDAAGASSPPLGRYLRKV